MSRFRRLLPRRRGNPLERLAKHELEVDGIAIRAHELWDLEPGQAVQPDLPTFVLLHGLGVSSRYFVPLAEELYEHGRVVLFDLPGFAGLPQPERPLEIADYARVVRGALESLQVPGAPVLIGHSMGTQVVVEMLASDPDYAEYAVLLAPVLNPDERALWQVAWRFVQSALWENPLNTAVGMTAYLRCPAGWFAETVPRVLAYPMLRRLAGVRTTLMVVGGRRDYLSTRMWQESLIAELTGAEVVTLPRAAHAMVVDHADALAGEVLRLVGLAEGEPVAGDSDDRPDPKERT
ncbi:MAG: alpha/beta fold hydrolase [Micropruina sp.]|nr:alpha/beta fold hydrolase [Micropruina sp.]